MNVLLDFLNTTDFDTLTGIPGVTRQLAGNLIAARPFDSEEDVLKVKGMGKATLTRLQAHAEGQSQPEESSAMIPVEEEALPAPVEQTQPAQEASPEQDSFLKRLGRAFVAFLKALMRLIMLAILFTAVGGFFYYGLPYLRTTFLEPVEQNTAQIQSMQNEIESLQTQLDEMNARLAVLEDSIESHTASIDRLEIMQADLETQLQENNDAALLALKQEVMFTRALDVLARARLYLAQSNFGLAKADLQTARDLLAELQAEKEDGVLANAIERLDLALGNLPDFPVVAAGDLEIAWQILISGEAPVVATITSTPTVEVSPTPLATPTP